MQSLRILNILCKLHLPLKELLEVSDLKQLPHVLHPYGGLVLEQILNIQTPSSGHGGPGCPSSTWEAETGVVGVEGHPQLNEFKASLGYMRP